MAEPTDENVNFRIPQKIDYNFVIMGQLDRAVNGMSQITAYVAQSRDNILVIQDTIDALEVLMYPYFDDGYRKTKSILNEELKSEKINDIQFCKMLFAEIIKLMDRRNLLLPAAASDEEY